MSTSPASSAVPGKSRLVAKAFGVGLLILGGLALGAVIGFVMASFAGWMPSLPC
jgi:F0F1-type ATP synthase assembly protein I